jgi:uncharacterized membrane protein
MDFKKLRQNAKQTVQRHYLILTAIALFAVLLGADFGWTGAIHETADRTRITEKSDDNFLVLSHDSPSETITEIMEDQGLQIETESPLSTITMEAVDTASSGSLWTRVLEGIHSLSKAASAGAGALIVLATGIVILVSVFFINVLKMVLRRLYLEARIYDHVPLRHAAHIASIGQWGHVALAYFRKQIRLFLWSLTIVGGCIKHFSYLLVPYILAENPSMSGKEAIQLSRKMMDGHKLEAFRLQLSLLGWEILNLCTLGIAGVLWTDAYTTAVWSEYYTALRAKAKEEKLAGSEQLNDVYLFEKADEDSLNRAYRDIRLDERYCRMNAVELNGAQKFFARYLGIWFGSNKKLRLYQGVEDLKSQVTGSKEAVAGTLYPSRLSPLYRKQTSHLYGHLSSQRAYSVWTLILLFVCFSFLAWGYEAVLLTMQSGQYTSPGFLHGPWLPLAGSIFLLSIVLLTSLPHRPVPLFIGSLLIAGLTEFCTSLVLENMYGIRWWDYSGWQLNIGGRTCLESIIVLAVLSGLIMMVIAPVVDNWLSRRKPQAVLIVSLVLLVLFGWDCIASRTRTGSAIMEKDTAVIRQVQTDPYL